MMLGIKRVLKSGFINFWRNGFVSLASILIMTVTLVVIGTLLFGSALFNGALIQLKNKVDINVYFTVTAPEEEILSLKDELEKLPEVKEIAYISREQALLDFQERHKDDDSTLKSISVLGENPFGAALTIRTRETSQYGGVAKYINDKNTPEALGGKRAIISKVNYFDNKEAINALTRISESAKRIGSVAAIIFAIMAGLITFNTIQLVIHSTREEIAVMRLVGASNRYIKGPFLVTGAMYGILGGLFALILLYPLAISLAPWTKVFFGGIDMVAYYVSNFPQIFLIIMGTGVGLGILATYYSVRKYIKV